MAPKKKAPAKKETAKAAKVPAEPKQAPAKTAAKKAAPAEEAPKVDPVVEEPAASVQPAVAEKIEKAPEPVAAPVEANAASSLVGIELENNPEVNAAPKSLQELTVSEKRKIREMRFQGIAQQLEKGGEGSLDTRAVIANFQEEQERRRQRALKFGVETKEVADEKRKERLARFGDGTTDAEAHKQEQEEEKARRLAREARFGEDLANLAGPKKDGDKKRKNILEMSLDEYRLKDAKKNKHIKGGGHDSDRRKKKAGFKTLRVKDKKHVHKNVRGGQ